MEINGTFSLPVHHRSNLQVWLTSALNTEHVVTLIEKWNRWICVGKLQEGRSSKVMLLGHVFKDPCILPGNERPGSLINSIAFGTKLLVLEEIVQDCGYKRLNARQLNSNATFANDLRNFSYADNANTFGKGSSSRLTDLGLIVVRWAGLRSKSKKETCSYNESKGDFMTPRSGNFHIQS
ncbi:hypothetical protein L2E82_01894 [Cichorium intybus]|uniref:Uncharacterized protein n=1 Tax=Cichorium intybus TaxID=13427 RepID=A0ACB9H0N2_CICIN|nr:hypothetical protein L2E82_01894 [Cichorium intybus]